MLPPWHGPKHRIVLIAEGDSEGNGDRGRGQHAVVEGLRSRPRPGQQKAGEDAYGDRDRGQTSSAGASPKQEEGAERKDDEEAGHERQCARTEVEARDEEEPQARPSRIPGARPSRRPPRQAHDHGDQGGHDEARDQVAPHRVGEQHPHRYQARKDEECDGVGPSHPAYEECNGDQQERREQARVHAHGLGGGAWVHEEQWRQQHARAGHEPAVADDVGVHLAQVPGGQVQQVAEDDGQRAAASAYAISSPVSPTGAISGYSATLSATCAVISASSSRSAPSTRRGWARALPGSSGYPGRGRGCAVVGIPGVARRPCVDSRAGRSRATMPFSAASSGRSVSCRSVTPTVP